MKRLTPFLLISAACLLAACTDPKTPKAPPNVPTPKAAQAEPQLGLQETTRADRLVSRSHA